MISCSHANVLSREENGGFSMGCLRRVANRWLQRGLSAGTEARYLEAVSCVPYALGLRGAR